MVPESSRGPENEAARLSSLPMQATVLLLKNLKPHFTPRRLYFGRACALAGERRFICCACQHGWAKPALLSALRLGLVNTPPFSSTLLFPLPVGQGPAWYLPSWATAEKVLDPLVLPPSGFLLDPLGGTAGRVPGPKVSSLVQSGVLAEGLQQPSGV